jgi:TetR/AcrR family transcriptional regulator, tetracycline repressor protein
MSRETLSRDKVLDAALRLADRHGLGALSMRRLAAELGVEAMSLYNHVANKGDLLDGIVSRVFETVPLPDPATPWEERLRLLCRRAHAAFVAHPEAVRALASNQANPRSPGALRLIDALLGALLDAGLDEPAAARRYRSLFGLLLGSALVGSSAAGAQPGGSPERDEPIAAYFRRQATAEQLPNLRRTLPALMDIACFPDFDQELELYLGGLRRGRSDRG